MSRKDDVPAGARQMPDFGKIAEINRRIWRFGQKNRLMRYPSVCLSNPVAW